MIAEMHVLSECKSAKVKPMEKMNRAEAEAGKTRAKLEGVIEKAKEVCDRLQEQTVAAAKATDKTIREKPYHAIGVALGVGVLVGVLVMWSRRDSGPLPEHGLRPSPGD
jgi:ElaB/YqjD/DUF883 family membrane-anchored ribosome-binding protein